ncbi:hypothetical protein [Sinorhizobium chiapasense]|uniref:Uncharacterized protein n=1 Tax=Sinorhizobium chiapasense TaxID=501572 RepID=A0ABZ2BC61_9HYPH
MKSTPEPMPLDRALAIVRAINQRAFFAMGIADKVDALTEISLRDMITATDRVRQADGEAPSDGGKRTFHVVPDDRLIAAAYALEHYDGDDSAVVVMPGRNMFGEPCRKALGVVLLDGLSDPESEE